MFIPSIWQILLDHYGVNFTNILRTAFMHEDPENSKNTVRSSDFFALLGSAYAKAASRTLMKLTPGVAYWVFFPPQIS